jgi:hypothetical protein
MTTHDGVESNARLTGAVGAVLLVSLAIEGVTVPSVRQMFALHVFVGLFVIPVVCLKLATTGYRFFHYYRGTAAYRDKGPPNVVLRITAPLVIASTIAVLGTGVVTLAVGPRHSDAWLTAHQASVIAWIALTAVHVLGHALDTWRLTTAEMRDKPPIPRRGVRVGLVAGSMAIGLALGVASLGWTSAWDNRPRHLDGARVDQPVAITHRLSLP